MHFVYIVLSCLSPSLSAFHPLSRHLPSPLLHTALLPRRRCGHEALLNDVAQGNPSSLPQTLAPFKKKKERERRWHRVDDSGVPLCSHLSCKESWVNSARSVIPRDYGNGKVQLEFPLFAHKQKGTASNDQCVCFLVLLFVVPLCQRAHFLCFFVNFEWKYVQTYLWNQLLKPRT